MRYAGRAASRRGTSQNSWYPRVFSARRRGTDASARAIARRSRVPRPRGVLPRPLMNAHFSAVLLAPMSGARRGDGNGRRAASTGCVRLPARARARRVLGHPTAAIRPRPRLPDAAPPAPPLTPQGRAHAPTRAARRRARRRVRHAPRRRPDGSSDRAGAPARSAEGWVIIVTRRARGGAGGGRAGALRGLRPGQEPAT